MKNICKNIKVYFLIIFLFLPFLNACSWFQPGTVEDPDQAVGAPTEPEEIEEGYEEGANYPEEYE
ncbi:MAG: hypothetical protein RIG61_05105 [Deltaproteobacteria bacterium]